MFGTVKKILREACVMFTLLTFILYCIGYIIVSKTITLNLGSIAILFVMCLVLCLFKRILYIKNIPLFYKAVIHYVIVLGSAFLLFSVIGKVVTTSLASLIMLSVITLIYTIATIIILLISSKNENATGEYTSIFNK